MTEKELQDGLYTLFDTKAEDFGPIFQSKNDRVAVRSVVRMFAQHERDGLYLEKEDFILFQMGIWNRESMLIEACTPRVVPFTEEGALQMKKMKEESNE